MFKLNVPEALDPDMVHQTFTLKIDVLQRDCSLFYQPKLMPMSEFMTSLPNTESQLQIHKTDFGVWITDCNFELKKSDFEGLESSIEYKWIEE